MSAYDPELATQVSEATRLGRQAAPEAFAPTLPLRMKQFRGHIIRAIVRRWREGRVPAGQLHPGDVTALKALAVVQPPEIAYDPVSMFMRGD